jgi:hypothetical protein
MAAKARLGPVITVLVYGVPVRASAAGRATVDACKIEWHAYAMRCRLLDKLLHPTGENCTVM